MTTARVGSFAALVLTGVLVAVSPAADVDVTKATDSETRMKKDLAFLASDECEGRGPTTKGIDKAADYIAAEFKKLGLKPLGKNDSYFQSFTIPCNRLEKDPVLVFKNPKGEEVKLKLGTDYQPFGLSFPGAVKDVPVVFVGYGMTGSKNFDYDDYKDIQASGAVVIALTDTPRPGDKKANIDGQRRRDHGTFTSKMHNAESHGALGIIYVNDSEISKDGDGLLDFNYTATSRMPEKKLPALMIKRSVLETMLKSVDKKLTDLEKKIDDDLKPASVELKGWTVTLEMHTKRDTHPAKNVIGVLEGAGPLADETVVVGAHYDHLGYGGSSSLTGQRKMAIHHGADDNGSGTTAMLEMVRRFTAMKDRKGRRIIFMAFSCEEMGLIGSEHYCKQPLIPLEKTVAMVNLDMVGRLDKDATTGKDKLIIEGTGTAKGFSELVDNLNKKHGFQIAKKAGGMGPSDQASFYKQKIPVLFFFTGDHKDYHRPSDTFDKINYSGMRRIVEMAEELTQHLATVEKRPEYVKIDSPSRTGGGPRLGIAPDYADDNPGVLVGSVTDGMPAAKAGIKGGDRIVEIGGKEVKNLEDYMQKMATQKLGETIEVGVMREKKLLKLPVKLE